MSEWSWEFIISAAVLIFIARSSRNFGFYFKFSFYYLTGQFLSIISLPIFFVNFIRKNEASNSLLFGKCLVTLSKLFLDIKWNVRGRENLKTEKSCIFIANHQSSLDVLGMAYFRLMCDQHFNIIGKRELLLTGPFGFTMLFGGGKFINRKGKGKTGEQMNEIVDNMKANNEHLWIFPEGTRSNNGKINQFKKGAFHAAVRAQIPIIPIVFSSYKNFIDYDEKTFKSGDVIISILPEISTIGMNSNDVDLLLDRTREIMAENFIKTSKETKQFKA